jgi:hypothetical protein
VGRRNGRSVTDSEQHVLSLLCDPVLKARLSPRPAWGEVQSALRRYGRPCILLNSAGSLCAVFCPDGQVVAIQNKLKANPAGAALACLRELIVRERKPLTVPGL